MSPRQASLWLLHWKLLEAPSIATAWDFTFNQFRSVEFTQETLFERLRSYNDGFSKSIADGSLKKDVACLIRMYVKQSGSKSVVNEDMLDCPFAELGAIAPCGDFISTLLILLDRPKKISNGFYR